MLVCAAAFCALLSPGDGARLSWDVAASPSGDRPPAVTPFLGGCGLRFGPGEARWVDLGQGEGESLCVSGPLTLGAVVRVDAAPRDKASIVSKWRTADGARSYELGITSSGRPFLTISASGNWDRQARELVGRHALEVGKPYALAAVYEPGGSMRLYVNGVASGETRVGVPESVYYSETPVLLGTRPGGEDACAFVGVLGDVVIAPEAWSGDQAREWTLSVGLTEEPAALAGGPRLTPPCDLGILADAVRAWSEPLVGPGEPYGAYSHVRGDPPDMYASADLAWIRWMMNDLDDLTPEQRAEWIDFIQDQQDPADGHYRHVTGHCATHAFCHATGALNALGGAHRHPPALLDRYRDVEAIPAWLDSLNWVNQWGASHDIWGAGVPLACTPSTPDAWREALFEWLDAELDPETGFWRKGVEPRSDLEAVGGAFHIWPIYAALGRDIPYPEKVIDHVLALQWPDGSFDGSFNYGHMDAVWVLEQAVRQTDHRREDVRAALDRSLVGILELLENSPERFLASPHGTESRIAALAVLQAALPERFAPTPAWRNPWHEKELFVIRFEER